MAQGKSDTTPASPDVLQVQHQIRANASELQDYFADLYKWEKTISQEEETRKQTPSQQMAVPLPRGRKEVTVSSTPSPVPEAAAPAAIAQEKRADAHTYDNGYKKWEKFDVVRETARALGYGIGSKPDRSRFCLSTRTLRFEMQTMTMCSNRRCQ
jgi:hypothetical protein